MSSKLLRLAYACEFLLALIAIFTAWSEIGGQTVLDVMSWAWKFGLSLALASAAVAYSGALVTEEKIWNQRSARWATVILVLLLVMGGVTYYYALQVDANESDDTTSSLSNWPLARALQTV